MQHIMNYINTQLDTINTPIISFFKPVIKRIVDNNINKVNSFLDLNRCNRFIRRNDYQLNGQ